MKILQEILSNYKHRGISALSKHVSEKEDNIVIDWEAVSKEKAGDERYGIFYSFLCDLGILSMCIKGNYLLIGGGYSILNPTSHPFPATLYFTRQEDVEEYDKAFYKNAVSRQILKGIKVIPSI